MQNFFQVRFENLIPLEANFIYKYIGKKFSIYFVNLTDMKESDDLSIIHKTVVQVAELLGLEKSYATLSLLKQTKNVNILLQLIRYAYYTIYIIFIYLCYIFTSVFFILQL